MWSRKNIVLLASVAVTMLSAVTASAASAKPAWKLNSVELEGVELVAGVANPSSLSLPGVTVTCEHMAFTMNIWNVGENGRAELTGLWPFECRTSNPNCTLLSMEGKRVPWLGHAVPGAPDNYLVIEGIDISVVFGGSLCALSGVLVEVTGTAGGLFENSSLVFNKASFEATGTTLRYGLVKVEWTGSFSMEAFEKHREQTLELL